MGDLWLGFVPVAEKKYRARRRLVRDRISNFVIGGNKKDVGSSHK
jgi:hypothetical protein